MNPYTIHIDWRSLSSKRLNTSVAFQSRNEAFAYFSAKVAEFAQHIGKTTGNDTTITVSIITRPNELDREYLLQSVQLTNAHAIKEAGRLNAQII